MWNPDDARKSRAAGSNRSAKVDTPRTYPYTHTHLNPHLHFRTEAKLNTGKVHPTHRSQPISLMSDDETLLRLSTCHPCPKSRLNPELHTICGKRANVPEMSPFGPKRIPSFGTLAYSHPTNVFPVSIQRVGCT
jgi:hypothetical protein